MVPGRSAVPALWILLAAARSRNWFSPVFSPGACSPSARPAPPPFDAPVAALAEIWLPSGFAPVVVVAFGFFPSGMPGRWHVGTSRRLRFACGRGRAELVAFGFFTAALPGPWHVGSFFDVLAAARAWLPTVF